MIDVAIEAARKGGELANKYFKSQLKVSYKANNTPVTRADREVEQLIRKIIAKKFPDHGIIGEEFPPVNPKAHYQWLIDPIDGTKDFVRDLPFWSTLVAILYNGKPIIGIANYVTTNELFVAEKGKGTFLNGKRTKVSKISDIKLAYMANGSIHRFEKIGKLGNLSKISATVQGRGRGFGGYSTALILKGNIDIYLDFGSIYDFAAPAILVEEAGGKFTDFEGKFSLTSYFGAFTNGQVHDQVLKLLNSK